jgi:hypothetical protein
MKEDFKEMGTIVEVKVEQTKLKYMQGRNQRIQGTTMSLIP